MSEISDYGSVTIISERSALDNRLRDILAILCRLCRLCLGG